MMNYPNPTPSGLAQAERPPTEIESEMREAIAVCQVTSETISTLETRLHSVVSPSMMPENQLSPQPQSRPLLSPLAEQIRNLTEQHRENQRRITSLIDYLQVPF